jgi:hypothetical protein
MDGDAGRIPAQGARISAAPRRRRRARVACGLYLTNPAPGPVPAPAILVLLSGRMDNCGAPILSLVAAIHTWKTVPPYSLPHGARVATSSHRLDSRSGTSINTTTRLG